MAASRHCVGALFATAGRSRHGRPRLRASLIGWYLLTTALHALWDAASSIAFWLTLLLTGTPMQWTLIGQGEAPPGTSEQMHLYTAANWAVLLVDGLVGLAILVVRWHHATAVPPMQMPPPVARIEAPQAGPSGPHVPVAGITG